MKERKNPLPGVTDKGQTFADDTPKVAESPNPTSQNRRAGRMGGGAWSRNAARFFGSRTFLDAALPWPSQSWQPSTGRAA